MASHPRRHLDTTVGTSYLTCKIQTPAFPGINYFHATMNCDYEYEKNIIDYAGCNILDSLLSVTQTKSINPARCRSIAINEEWDT